MLGFFIVLVVFFVYFLFYEWWFVECCGLYFSVIDSSGVIWLWFIEVVFVEYGDVEEEGIS